jgi:predicted esterase
LYFPIVAFNNVIDYGTNFKFVEHVLSMGSIPPMRAIFWGHSDGAVIAAKIGLSAPTRCERLLLESLHFEPGKPSLAQLLPAICHTSRGCKRKDVKAADRGSR